MKPGFSSSTSTSRGCAAGVSCKGQRNEASRVSASGTPVRDTLGQHQALGLQHNKWPEKTPQAQTHREAFCMMQQDDELQNVLVEDT